MIGHFINWIGNLSNTYQGNKKLITDIQKQKEEIDKSSHSLSEKEKELERKQIKVYRDIELSLKNLKVEESNANERKKQVYLTVEKFLQEKTDSFPWLSTLVSDYLDVLDGKLISYLENKKHPAKKAAEVIRELKYEKRTLEQNYRNAKYTIEYYEALFPNLKEYYDDGLEELSQSVIDSPARTLFDDEYDPAYDWLSTDEYNSLTNSERYQRALDNYFRRRKSKWLIGKDYERYIGYLYETDGYSVIYQGIKKRFEDLGIDLVCSKGDATFLIQCKYWNQNKLIREASINQLFGTSVKYTLERFYKGEQIPFLFSDLLSNYKITPILITSTKLSDTASDFANALGVIVKENIPLERYPIIKCNINRQTGEKIYHLPFDQQYDNTIIERERGEFYASTIAEAEKKKFRRAYRWRGD